MQVCRNIIIYTIFQIYLITPLNEVNWVEKSASDVSASFIVPLNILLIHE